MTRTLYLFLGSSFCFSPLKEQDNVLLLSMVEPFSNHILWRNLGILKEGWFMLMQLVFPMLLSQRVGSQERLKTAGILFSFLLSGHWLVL